MSVLCLYRYYIHEHAWYVKWRNQLSICLLLHQEIRWLIYSHVEQEWNILRLLYGLFDFSFGSFYIGCLFNIILKSSKQWEWEREETIHRRNIYYSFQILLFYKAPLFSVQYFSSNTWGQQMSSYLTYFYLCTFCLSIVEFFYISFGTARLRINLSKASIALFSTMKWIWITIFFIWFPRHKQ